MFKFENGDIVKDVITGFKGVVMARVDYFTGCNQYGVSPMNVTSEGKKPDWEYIDENRLTSCKKGIKLPNQIKPIFGADGNVPKRT